MVKKYLEGTANNICDKANGWILALDSEILNKKNCNEIFIDLVRKRAMGVNGKRLKLRTLTELTSFFLDDLKRNSLTLKNVKSAILHLKIDPLKPTKNVVITYECECIIQTASTMVSRKKLKKEKLLSEKVLQHVLDRTVK